MYRAPGSPEPIHLLLIESDEAAARHCKTMLQHRGVTPGHVRVARDAASAQHLIGSARWDVVIFSLNEHDDGQRALVHRLRETCPGTAVVALSSQGSLTQAVDVMRLGADDFLIKPVSRTHLIAAVERAREKAIRRSATVTPAPQRAGAVKIIGTSPAMTQMLRTVERAATSKATVFLKGESGTGKELCAEAVHDLSPRAGGPMISLNCSAIPRELMESEIFGHEKGAFTGAAHAREGAAERADGGTLFLDEICEMELALQAKLLRFIQTGQFTRVGGSQLRTVDVRFVCATNKDPFEAVRTGAFREDLYYRLHVLPVTLPPLRERDDDVLHIARHALAQYAAEEGKGFRALDADTERLLMSYWWPGNVRELLNVIRNIVVMNDGDLVTTDMIPLAFAQMAGESHAGLGAARPTEAGEAPRGGDILRPLWQHEQDIIERAIAACGGNIGKAAAHLDISPSTIYRKRQSWAHLGAA
ncbi:MAG: sigma-54-dependent transcriptional regulator [Hyphomicrobiales bacterium]